MDHDFLGFSFSYFLYPLASGRAGGNETARARSVYPRIAVRGNLIAAEIEFPERGQLDAAKQPRKELSHFSSGKSHR